MHLKESKIVLGLFPSDLLPHSITQPSTVIVNTVTHTQAGSHWLAIRLELRSSTTLYFDAYGMSPHTRHTVILQTQLYGPTL